MAEVDTLRDKLLYPTIPVGFLDDVFQAAYARDLDVEAILAANGLSLAVLKEPGLRVSVDKYAEVLRQLGNQTQDAFLGFFSKPVPLKAYNVFCYSLVGCRTLEELIQQANDFYALFTDEFYWQYRQEKSEIIIQVHITPVLDVDYRFIVHSLQLMCIRLFAWILGETVELNSVDFTFSKNATDENLTYLLGDHINYDCDENLIRINSRFGKARLSCTRDQIEPVLHNSRRLFLVTHNRHPVSQQVRRLLLANKYEEWLGGDEVAEQLGITPNLLWRKLKKEGNSFLDIRDDIKRDWALVLLEDPANTVEMVADQLRYSDVSAFRKAFKKWTGLQPVQYRALLG
ncbi:AraC family transcriptional regulator [Maricurvus nonylphenolicus]|uniref:AraC family transcriptional regulator n=1 Tax=Maricurvus nonylphenolicus TaxID=1008307 RepID=UPI0036F2B389